MRNDNQIRYTLSYPFYGTAGSNGATRCLRGGLLWNQTTDYQRDDMDKHHTLTQNSDQGNLYVVATPIGNMADITLRAIQTLKDVSLIAAEDTRHTKRLLDHYGIRKHAISFHEHNEDRKTVEVIDRLRRGESIALVSNAGTPTLSDPGYRLIKEAAENNIRVIPIPGASAALASLSVSGLPTDAYVFMGFLPRKRGKRIKILNQLAQERKTIILYESPRRVITLIQDLVETLGDRQGVLSREITKKYEEFIRGPLTEILNILEQRDEVRGECTLVVKGCLESETTSLDTIRQELMHALEKPGEKLSELTRKIADQHGLSRKTVYAEALKIKSLQ